MADITVQSHSNFLTVYGGEVVLAYNEASKLKDRLMNRTISSGKSASFPTYAIETAKMHTPGEDILGSVTGDNASSATSGEKTIVIDKLIYAAQLVDDLDEMKAHYDIRGSLASQSGAALAIQHDAFLLAAMTKDATTTETLAAAAAFSASAQFATDAELLTTIENCATKFDNLAVPANERCLVLRPYEFYQLLNTDAALGRDFNTSGDRAKGQQSFNYLGFEIISMKTMADYAGDNVAAQKGSGGGLDFGGVDPGTDHSFDGSLWWATAFHKGTAGTVTLKGVSAEANYIPERNATLLNTKMAIGVDSIRPDGCIKIVAND